MKAFPLSKENNYGQDGMDLRDYFAAKALPLIFNKEFWLYRHTFTTAYQEQENLEPEEFLAKCAYDIANAMMKAREQ